MCMDEQALSQRVDTSEPFESCSLEEFIEHNIFHAAGIKRELDKYEAKTLRSYHYGPHNNLLHCLVENLIAQRHASSFNNLIERYKPIFRTLVYENGLDVNEVNDYHMTPLMIAYTKQKTKNVEMSDKVSLLTNFLERQLHANPTYFSIAPELRILKRCAWEFITCQWCTYKDE